MIRREFLKVLGMLVVAPIIPDQTLGDAPIIFRISSTIIIKERREEEKPDTEEEKPKPVDEEKK